MWGHMASSGVTVKRHDEFYSWGVSKIYGESTAKSRIKKGSQPLLILVQVWLERSDSVDASGVQETQRSFGMDCASPTLTRRCDCGWEAEREFRGELPPWQHAIWCALFAREESTPSQETAPAEEPSSAIQCVIN